MFNRLWSMSLKLLLVLSFFLPMSVWAGHIIRITETSPFPAQVAVSSTTVAVYTVTNNASKVSVTPVDQTQYPKGISRLSTSTCGSLLGPGQSCTVELQLQATSIPQTISFALKQWAKPSADGVQLPISVSVTSSQPAQSDLSVAVGHAGLGSSRQAAVAVSTNRAVNWESAAVTGLPLTGQLNAASCTGSGSTAICIGAGEGSANISGPLLLVQSVDGGANWAVQEIMGSLPNAIFNGASCTGSGSDAVCVAVGMNRANGNPIAAVGTNGGSSWTMATVPSPVGTPAPYTTVSCTGSGTSAICVAAGQNVGETMLDVSVDGGSSWATAAIAPFADGFLKSASCTGAESTAVCVAVGEKGPPSNEALVLVGTNSGSSWASINGLFSGDNVLLNSVNCTGSGLTALCVAGGMNNTTSLSVVAVSENGGSIWNDTITLGLPPTINAVSCTGEGSNTVCVAVGDGAALTPAISVSTDRGATWTVRSVTNPPADSTLLQTVNCTGAGATAVCVAGGYLIVSGPPSSAPPIIITSNDGGTTWTVRSVTGFDPDDGAINGTAGSASLASFGTSSHGAASGFGVSYQQKTFGIKNKLEHFIK